MIFLLQFFPTDKIVKFIFAYKHKNAVLFTHVMDFLIGFAVDSVNILKDFHSWLVFRSSRFKSNLNYVFFRYPVVAGRHLHLQRSPANHTHHYLFFFSPVSTRPISRAERSRLCIAPRAKKAVTLRAPARRTNFLLSYHFPNSRKTTLPTSRRCSTAWRRSAPRARTKFCTGTTSSRNSKGTSDSFFRRPFSNCLGRLLMGSVSATPIWTFVSLSRGALLPR